MPVDAASTFGGGFVNSKGIHVSRWSESGLVAAKAGRAKLDKVLLGAVGRGSRVVLLNSK